MFFFPSYTGSFSKQLLIYVFEIKINETHLKTKNCSI